MTKATQDLFSPVIAGVWKWGLWGHRMSIAEQEKLILKSIELGVTTFDHADIYSDHTAEEEFGMAMKDHADLRESIQLISKCGIQMPSERRKYDFKSYDTSKSHIIWSAENSLINLRTDYLDVLLIHRPSPLMDPDEIAEAFEILRSQGKVRQFGVSNFTPSQFAMLHSRIPLVTNQIQASLLHLDPFLDGSLDQLTDLRIRPTIWSPLGGGQLFNKSGTRISEIANVARSLLDKYDVSRLDQIYLAWLMRHPSRPIPVLGTARTERLAAAFDASRIDMSREDWFKLWIAATGEDVP